MSTFRCRYCRGVHDGSSHTCPLCGAPIDITARITDSGWMEQPMIGDMTRIRCGDTRCQIAGTLVQVAEFSLGRSDWIYFSHHALLWTDALTTVRNMAAEDRPDRWLSGGRAVDPRGRPVPGLPVILLEGHGPGHIGVSDNHAGEIIAIPLQHGREILAHQSRFLCATGNVTHQWQWSGVRYKIWKDAEQEPEYPIGRYCDSFTATGQPGLVLLHSPGNTFIRDLGDDESILIQPAALVYWDADVDLSLHLEHPRNVGAASMKDRHNYRLVWLRARGPGRVAVQSVYEPAECEGKLDIFSFDTRRSW